MLNNQTHKNMKNFKFVIYADEDFNSSNIISSVTFECKSVTTAFKIMENHIPNNFGSYKLFDSDKCRCFSTKENHLKYN